VAVFGLGGIAEVVQGREDGGANMIVGVDLQSEERSDGAVNSA